MKKIAIFSLVFCSLLISSSFAQDVKVKDDKVKADKSDGKMTGLNTGKYKASYSADFQMGNSANVQKIMSIWQDWDDNMLDRSTDVFADTLTMYFSDGSVVKGRAQNLAEGKKYRGSFTSVTTQLHAVVPLRSNNRNQDVVAVWGMETNTHPDGKVAKKEIHEVWFFNKDGKIAEMRQWTADVK